MALDFLVLLDTDRDLTSIKEVLDPIIGHPLVQSEDGFKPKFVGRVFGIDLVLYGDHDFEDDNGVEYSKYAYVLSPTPLDLGRDLRTYNAMFASAIAFLAYYLSEKLACRTLVVEDLVKKTAAFANGQPQAFAALP